MNEASTLDKIFFCSFWAIIILLILYIIFSPYLSCYSRWKDSGMESSYAWFKGCTVKLPNGQWIPDSNFTVMQPVLDAVDE